MSKRVWGLTRSLLGKQKDDEYVKRACRYFCPRQLFFSLSLPCFCSTRSVVFVGSAADDAATLESGWWDFYRRTGNMGHKTCLHFPQPEKNSHPPLLPLPPPLSKHETSVGSLYHVWEGRDVQHSQEQGGHTSDTARKQTNCRFLM